MIRIAGIAAIAGALLVPAGAAGAAPGLVGLTACDHPGCAIVTQHDLDIKRATNAVTADSARPIGTIGFTE